MPPKKSRPTTVSAAAAEGAAASTKRATASGSKRATVAAASKRAASKKSAATGAATGAATAKKEKARASGSKKRMATTDRNCRTQMFDAYRTQMSEDCNNKNGECDLVKLCKDHGVGTALWPLTSWRVPDDQYDQYVATYGNGDKAAAHAHIKAGHQCMDTIMWSDKSFTDAMTKQCPGADQPPKYLTEPAAAPAAAPAAGGAAKKKAKATKKASTAKAKKACTKSAVAKKKRTAKK